MAKKVFTKKTLRAVAKKANHDQIETFKENHGWCVELMPLRQKYGQKLKPHQRDQIESFIRAFANMAYKKYAAGAKEHKNRELTVPIAKKELLGEAIDMFIYTMVVANERDHWDNC